MRNRYIKLLALIISSIALFFAIYIITQKPYNTNLSDYKTSVVYPTTPVSLSLWLPSDEKGNLDFVVDQYQKVHPNVKIGIEYVDINNYQARVLQAIAENKLPDLLVFRDDSLPLYKNSLQPAPTSVYTPDQFSSTFADFATKQLVVGNTIYGAPLGIATLGLIYNQNRFDQAKITSPPTNWVEFDAVNDKLRQKTDQTLFESGVAFGSPNIHSYPDIISVLMMQNGATITNQPPTKATFEQPDPTGYYSGAKALAYYASFAQADKANYSWSDSLGDSVSALAQNKTAAIIDYPMAAKTIADQNPTLPIRFSALPQTNSNKPINYGTFLIGSVSKTTKTPIIAWDFWGFATTKQAQRDFSTKSYWPASRKDLVAEQTSNNILSPFAKQISTAQDWYKGLNLVTNANLREMLNSYLSGLDSQVVVNNASTKVTSSIEQANAR